MTADEIKKRIFASYSLEGDTGKTSEQKKLVEQNANEVSSILARLDKALEEAGFGGISINSGYRSTAAQAALKKKSEANGGKPSTAKPGTSAHEWGSGIDCGCKKGKEVFDDFVKFSMKWFSTNGIKFDQLIDESGSVSNKQGWLHVGLTRLGKKEGNRNQYYIMWGGYKKAFSTVNDYINHRNSQTGKNGSGPQAVNDGSNLYQSETPPGSYAPGSSVKKMTPEETAEAYKQYEDEELAALEAARAAAGAEYEMLMNNVGQYGEYTEEEIMMVEADIDDLDIPVEPSSSPVADQEVDVNDGLTSNMQQDNSNMMEQSDAENNTSQVSVDDNQQEKPVEHTRIYQMFKSTIELDEMSLSIEGTNSLVDPSTGIHTDALNSNVNTKPVGGPNGNIVKSVGSSSPLIRINDAYFSGGQIVKFQLETTGFLPTIMVELRTQTADLVKTNSIKEGDICSVFITQDNDILKSYRGDFKITSANQGDKKFRKRETGLHLVIFGELFIPALYSGNNTFAVAGSSMDAIQEAAKKLGLGYFFCDEEDTNDQQVWHCISNGRQRKGEEPPIVKFIKKTALHSYKDENAFYDCWIDPRYGISFLNINKLLGEDGLDEQVDMAFFNNAMTNNTAASGEYIDEKSSKKYNKMMPKIFNNFAADGTSASEFYVISAKELIDNSISDKIGLHTKKIYNIKNAGVNKEDNKIEFKSTLCVNKTKLEHGFTILAGPGQNQMYKQADNGDYAEQHIPVSGGAISHTQSDVDAEQVKNSGSNMLSSGNTHKFYDIAPDHNDLNNSQLRKKMIQLTINGKNFQIMRGEKIPVLLTDGGGSKLTLAPTSGIYNTTLNQMYELGSGWFIIHSIVWKYDVSRKEGGTSWTTEVALTRREWPIPGWIEKKEDDTDEIIMENKVDDSTALESKSDTESKEEPTAEQTNNADLPANGLSEKIYTLWNIVQNVVTSSNMEIKLVGGRRWAADENNNRIEGEPTIKEGDVYKFINAKGEIMWFSDKTSPHLYGNAIDIINGKNTDYNKLINTIVGSPEVLAFMLTNGIYGINETSRDDTGNTVKHFHMGVASGNSGDQSKFWSWIEKTILESSTFKYQDKVYNVNNYLQYNE